MPAMPKQQVSRKQLKLIQFLELLEGNSRFIATFMTEPSSPNAWRYIEGAALKAQLPHPPKKLENFLHIVSQHAVHLTTSELLTAVNNYHHGRKAAANSNRLAKCELTNGLGLGKDPLPCADLATQLKLTIILCDHMPDPHKCGAILVDHGNKDLAGAGEKVLIVPADNTWYVVKEHASVTFINSTGDIELIVI
ncbi:hypothetical protein M404DRAFT_24742 [Pisolithus tinctorius Marx 270]|uniref:Uncharacterized protein n=1 Tax=Pisolithus tinctorius Marx 270 TaxID=870435 RepID=A0A0C3JBS2_PISTI|nr:hypothetical protein M404DRAFT_24742 [Pisolithus tinctorius Marx 270]